ncbi:protein NUCLEAR FUSION DEFECTIVE 4 [Diospyros lotus]|uniref:protein NUCLEAR FUSION DEFECTIVE 4 n=1 Tax=Diospyros lotus TaxID=55363 RepID=UPI00225885DB|nr:protein NUCLEAR FUSION DEFECTIVE 4 [Diospyros lotus]
MALQWLSLVATIWLQSINGTNFNFPSYSSQLKRLLSMSQLQLNNLAFASDAGKLLGFLAGIAAVHLPLWLVLIIGSLLGLLGYGFQYLFIINRISSLSYFQVFLLTVLAGNSICWINTACYSLAIHNFPFDRQLAVGISTGYLGLSAKIYTDIVDAVFPSSPTDRAEAYLLLNSVLPLVVCVLASPIIRDINSGKSRRMEAGFLVMFVITIATGAYAVATSFGPTSSTGLSPLMILIGMAMFLLAPLVVPLAEQAMEKLQKKCWIRRDERRVHDLDIDEVSIDNSFERGEENGGKEGEPSREVHEFSEREEIGAKMMLMKVDFWLYFFIYMFGATLGLVYLNNLGQIAESRGFDRTSSLVSISSSFGFFGRLLPSLLDHFSRSKSIGSRPASIAAMMAPMSGAFFLLLNGTNLSLYISTAALGLCSGAITSIAVSTTAQLFGPKNFAVNHNVVVTNIPVGSFLFGDLAALLYRQHSREIGGRCMGTACYQTTFIIWGSICFLGTLLALVLHERTKKLFSHS